jgi:hypothetical protein
VYQTRGTHVCEYCHVEEIWLETANRRLILGYAEVWVPEPNSKRIFAAPDLIHHYIMAHCYLPPSVFIQAVEAFDFSSGWKGQRAAEEAAAKCLR